VYVLLFLATTLGVTAMVRRWRARAHRGGAERRPQPRATTRQYLTRRRASSDDARALWRPRWGVHGCVRSGPAGPRCAALTRVRCLAAFHIAVHPSHLPRPRQQHSGLAPRWRPQAVAAGQPAGVPIAGGRGQRGRRRRQRRGRQRCAAAVAGGGRRRQRLLRFS
jgi:hypothetical protein